MELGAFSISLAVKDLEASRDFYAKLGFEPMGGEADQGWLILRNGTSTLGLFQGMFDRNTLTFNPGWNQDLTHPDPFEDIRSIVDRLRAAGLEVSANTDESESGPAHAMLFDPDGNPVLIDQHR